MGSFVLIAVCLSGAEVFTNVRALLEKDRLSACAFPDVYHGSEIGAENWLYGQTGMAWLHLTLAPYIQNQVARKLSQAGSAPGGEDAAPSSAAVRDAFAEVLKYDIGVCLYAFVLCASFAWSFLGWEWIRTDRFACNPDDYLRNSAILGMAFFGAVVVYGILWWCCASAAASVSQGLHRVPVSRHPQGQPLHHFARGAQPYHHVPQCQQPNRAASGQLQGGQPRYHQAGHGVYCQDNSQAAVACQQMEHGVSPKAYLNVQDVQEYPQSNYIYPYAGGCARMCQPKQLVKLLACLSLDMCGDASYLVPELGEGADLAYAPAQAVALNMLFDSKFVAFVGLAEELGLGTDLVPTATFAWLLETFAPGHWLTRAVGIEAAPDYPPPLQWGPGFQH